MLATKKDLEVLEEEVEKKIDGLKDRVLKKGKTYTMFTYWSFDCGMHDGSHTPEPPKSLEERLSDSIERVERRQELLMQHLGLKFVGVDAVDEHEEIRKVKESTPETSPRKKKKVCNKCGEARSMTDYHRNRASKGSRRATCKYCVSKYMKAYNAQ